MRTPQLLCSAAAAVALAAAVSCNRGDTNDRAQRAATEVRQAASRAGDELADAWLTTQIQSKFFADRDVKARYIDVSTHDKVVTLEGYVQSNPVREHAVEIARNTGGVREVQDRLLIGQAPATAAERHPSAAEAVATSGAGGTAGKLDDARITTTIQSRYFLDGTVKGRNIDVDTRGGVVTLHGQVASEAERAQALRLARETEGVQRVEDMLTVDAALDRAASGTSGDRSTLDTIGERLDDGVVVTKLKAKFLADAQLKGSDIDVSASNGVVTLTGRTPDAASRQHALSVARETDGVTQVVDRLTADTSQKSVAKRRR